MCYRRCQGKGSVMRGWALRACHLLSAIRRVSFRQASCPNLKSFSAQMSFSVSLPPLPGDSLAVRLSSSLPASSLSVGVFLTLYRPRYKPHPVNWSDWQLLFQHMGAGPMSVAGPSPAVTYLPHLFHRQALSAPWQAALTSPPNQNTT